MTTDSKDLSEKLSLAPWPDTIKIEQNLTNQQKICSSDRYTYAKAIVNGKLFFYKKALTEKVGDLFDHELAWSSFLNKIQAKHPELNVRGLRIYAIKPKQAILTEYITAPFLADHQTVNQLNNYLDRYVAVLAAIDASGQNYLPAEPNLITSTPYDQIDKSILRYVQSGDLVTKHLISEAELQQALDLVYQAPPLTPCMQHGDFVPWHIFVPGKTWIIYDAEHASPFLPRFYDLAYSYARIATMGKNLPLANDILNRFVIKIHKDRNIFFAHFLPIVLVRSVGAILDAENDKQGIDYRAEAQQLFHRCLTVSSFDEFIKYI